MRLSHCLAAVVMLGALAVSADAALHNISLGDNFFAPKNTVVAPGDTVRWTWVGSFPHSTTSDVSSPISWDSGIKTTGTFNLVIPSGASAGFLPYHCEVHLFTMFDTLEVFVAPAEPTLFAFQLDESQAAACAGTGSSARGYGLAILSPDSTSLSLYVVHDVVSPTDGHIHLGAVCVGGGIAFPFTSPASPIQETFALSPTDVTNLFNGDFYVNIHSGSFPGGEIRGQIVQQPLQFAFPLDESQAAAGAGTGSLHSGYGIVELSADVTQLDVAVIHDIPSDSVLDGHIHAGAVGVGGGIVFPFSSSISPVSESFSIDTNQVKALLSEGYYVNIHTDAFPGGEIRGQVVRDVLIWSNPLTEAEAAAGAGTGSSATGFVVASLNKDFTRLTLHIEHDVASVIDGHVHLGAPGVGGAIQFPFSSSVSPINETWDVTPTDVANLLAGDLYVNIHSTSFPGGEIRGQLELETQSFNFPLTESEAADCAGTGSVATGVCTVLLKAGGREMTIVGSHDVAGATNAHVHTAPQCVSGGIAFGFANAGATPIREIWYLGESNIVDLSQEELYINVHSGAFPSGEIRGQIMNTPIGCCVGSRGDVNGDTVDADPVDLSYLVDFLFSGGAAPVCADEADINGDSSSGDPVDLSYLVDFLFSGGAGPAACS